MITKEAKCKFCGIAVHLQIDEDGLKFFKMDMLVSLAACNRCADFQERKSRLLDKAAKCGTALIQLRLTNRATPEMLDKWKARMDGVLKEWGELCLKFYGTKEPQSEFLVNGLAEQPEKTRTVLLIEESRMRRKAQEVML